MGLREVNATRVAAEIVEIYRAPNIKDWVSMIDPILKAAGLYMIGDGDVESIVIGDDLVIEVSEILEKYYIVIPMSVINDDDCIKAATEWGLRRKYDEIDYQIKEMRRMLGVYEARRGEVLNKINTL